MADQLDLFPYYQTYGLLWAELHSPSIMLGDELALFGIQESRVEKSPGYCSNYWIEVNLHTGTKHEALLLRSKLKLLLTC